MTTQTDTANSGNSDYTHITVVLDRSGSMGSIASDVIGGFNHFLSEQRQHASGHASLSLVQFDTGNPFEVIHDFRPLPMVPPLTSATYEPRGGTPLLDAVGQAINSLDRSLKGLRDTEQPGRVLFVIVTDGEENASHQFTHSELSEMIAARTSRGWQFVYLSADLAAFADSDRIGIRESHKMAFDKTSRGTTNAFRSMSEKVLFSRSGDRVASDAFFDEADRSKQSLECRRRASSTGRRDGGDKSKN